MSLELWKNNRLPSLTDTITAEGQPVDLTGSTVKLKARVAGSSALKIDASATPVVAASGTVRYDWAAADVDTVCELACWWEVTTSGKTQDTPEFTVIVKEHAPDAVEVPSPVGTDGDTTIRRGDSYLDAVGRALVYQLQVVDSPDLTGLDVVFRVNEALEKAMTVVDEDTLKVDLTSMETAALTEDSYAFEIEATVSVDDDVVTLLRATLTVEDDMASVS